jgi:predicted XRE-type DNA-binding protein
VKDFKDFAKNHEADFVKVSLCEYLNIKIEQSGFSKAEVIRVADLDRVYGYQIISGKRKPTREKLIQLAFGLRLDIEDAQALLKVAGVAPLYARIEREAGIIFCINHGYSLIETQSFLQKNQLRIIDG